MNKESESLLDLAKQALRDTANPQDALDKQRFFKTAAGEYGEGDQFLGVRVPATRKVAKAFADLPISDVLSLLHSSYHEERLLALLIMTHQFRKGNVSARTNIYQHYLDNTAYINNWDLVDTSAEHIVGTFLCDKPKTPLYKLSGSSSLWERRIAIMATFYFVKRNEFDDTLAIAKILLNDEEDLIHKAVGWMLREVGNRDRNQEEMFLQEHLHAMPRTMLRYAIEKFPESLRKQYLSGAILNHK